MICSPPGFGVRLSSSAPEGARELLAEWGGPVDAGEKKYVHGAFTEKYSLFHLGTRSLETMKDFGILPDFRRAPHPGPRNSTKQHPGRDMLEFCRCREADVLRFTTDIDVWLTSNISESGLRPSKTQQKISGRLTSDDTTQDRLDIRSYFDTARKHGHDVLTVLHALFTGSPWAPPAPGQA